MTNATADAARPGAAGTDTERTFRVQAIPAAVLERIRAAGHDDFDNPLVPITDDAGGSPMRCCLQPSAPGDVVYLISYRPFTSPGPYAEVGPVFVHAESCPGYSAVDRYPDGYRDWPTMIFRPYRYDGAIAYDAIRMGDASTADALVAEMFADPEIEFVHTRNVYAGCYMFAIVRAGA
jgi:Protein of unknown function (DUF1203)